MSDIHEKLDNEFELCFEAMNTTFYIAVSNSNILNWKESIMDWFSYVEREWSRFRQDNELSRINNSDVGESVVLSAPLFQLLKLAENYRQKTDGYFSPYLMEQMENQGYRQSFPFTNQLEDEAVEPTSSSVNLINACPFQFDDEKLMVTRIAGGMVDLGGIAKGYAVESAANWLKQFAEAKYGIVDGGGDISVWSNGEKVWKIGISHPWDENQEIKQISLTNGSIATSNIVYRSWWHSGQKKHHILNGKTGLPVDNGIIQATIITTNCLDAEVGAKLCFMETGTKLKDLLEKLNSHCKTVLVNCDRKIIVDKGEIA